MSLFGSLYRPQTSRATSKTIAGVCTRMVPDSPRRHRDEKSQSELPGGPQTQKIARRPEWQKSVEDIFVESLVAAGRCTNRTAHTYNQTWRRAASGVLRNDLSTALRSSRRHFSTTQSQAQPAAGAVAHVDEHARPGITKDEYIDLVNTYGLPSDLWDQPKFQSQWIKTPPTKAKQNFPLAPRLVLTAQQEDRPPYSKRKVIELENVHDQKVLRRLRRLLEKPPGSNSVFTIWLLYKSLPTPRPRYLTDGEVRDLFGHMAWVERPMDIEDTQPPVLTLLEECIGEDIRVGVVEWSTAINFAGRKSSQITTEDVKAVVELWLRMEDQGVAANHVTFNILYYIAIKAGRFALADTIYNELQARNLELDRYFRITQIYHAGMRGNGDGVRRAFNNLVNAGEIVDSAVMNCVIRSLIQAGEAPAAEHVFEKMKTLHESKFGTRGPYDWQSQRKLAIVLNETGKRLRKERKTHESSFFGGMFAGEVRREQIQRASPIAPTPRTYRMLLRYHARVSGDMSRIMELLEECKVLDIPTHGSVYMDIFQGFRVHGGYSFTPWSPSALEAFWQDFLKASSRTHREDVLSSEPVDSAESNTEAGDALNHKFIVRAEGLTEMEDQDLAPDDTPYGLRTPAITASLARTVLQAFYKCLGRTRMQAVYDEIQERWHPSDSNDLADVKAMVDEIVRSDM